MLPENCIKYHQNKIENFLRYTGPIFWAFTYKLLIYDDISTQYEYLYWSETKLNFKIYKET